MFFSKHKKRGADVGKAIRQTLLKGLVSDPNNKSITIPIVAINDPYVIGFIIYFSISSIDMIYEGAFWSNKKRIEFLVECWKIIGLKEENITKYTKLMSDQTQENIHDEEGQYSSGKFVAALVFGSAYGILTAEQLNDDIIVNAKKMIDHSFESVSEAGYNSALSAAVCEITIQNHMKSYYSHK